MGAECRCADLTPAHISQPAVAGGPTRHTFVAVSAGRYHTTAVTGALTCSTAHSCWLTQTRCAGPLCCLHMHTSPLEHCC